MGVEDTDQSNKTAIARGRVPFGWADDENSARNAAAAVSARITSQGAKQRPEAREGQTRPRNVEREPTEKRVRRAVIVKGPMRVAAQVFLGWLKLAK